MSQNIEINEQRSSNIKNNKLTTFGYMQLANLQNNVLTIFAKNKVKFENIIKLDSNFECDFYQPKEIIKVDKGLKKQILLKQLDKLMDQQAFLDKKLTQLRFQKQQENKKVNKFLQQKINPYQILTQVWKTHKKTITQSTNSEQRVESLNSTIGKIKSTILAMKKMQEKQQKTQFRSIQTINEATINQKYQKINKMYEESKITIKKMQESLYQLKQKYEQKVKQINQLNEKIFILEKQTRSQKKSKQEKQTDFSQKLEITKLKQNLFNLQKKLDKFQKWKRTLQQNSYENQLKGFKIYIQHNQNIPKSMQNNQKVFIQKQIEQIDDFLKHQNEQKIDNLQIKLPQISQLCIPEQKQQRRKSLMSTDRTFSSSKRKIQNCTDKNMNNIKYRKISINGNNDQSNKKFTRRNQLDLTFQKIQPY